MNTFGRLFRITIFGASHDSVVGITIDGCPSGIMLSEKDFENDLLRRHSRGKGMTTRHEKDEPKIISGLLDGHTTGAPLTILFENNAVQSADYDFVKSVPRPGHADWVAHKKYHGFNDYRGGGQFSGRMTVALVAAGVVAKKMLSELLFQARVLSVNGSEKIESQIDMAIAEGDSVGGIVECTVSGLPIGLGEPFFDSVESCISHLAFSVPGVKGIEFGDGFKVATMKGSDYNDRFADDSGIPQTNHSGGISGGLTTGNDLVFRVAVRPTASIAKPQETYDFENKKMIQLTIGGRHDVAIVLRTPVIFEAITAIVLADLWLMQGINE